MTGSLVSQYQQFAAQYQQFTNEMYKLVRLTDTIRELAEFGLDDMESPDAAVEALIEIIRLLDGDDA